MKNTNYEKPIISIVSIEPNERLMDDEEAPGGGFGNESGNLF